MNSTTERFENIEHEFILDLLYDFGIDNEIMPLLYGQVGGGETKVMKFIDIGGVYTYNVRVDKQSADDARLSIVTSKGDDCVTVLLFRKKKMAVLHNMSYYDDCAREGLLRPGGGGKLLRFTLNLIMRYKDEYDIKRILLKDNSFMICKGFEHTVKLAQLRLFTHGLPWYSTYGFKPYDASTGKPSDTLLQLLKQSQKIAESLETKKVDIIGIIKDNKLKYDMAKIKIMIDRYPLMHEFIMVLSNDYDKYCRLLYFILDWMFGKVMIKGLGNFHEKTFYLDI